MSDFDRTNERLERIASRIDGFPLDQMRAVRMTYLLQKKLRDRTNAVLKEYDLGDASYTVLAILYGTLEETSTASQLSQACGEKPANLTRLCDELGGRGLIERRVQPGDRRGVLIVLSDAGRTLVETVLPRVAGAIAPAFDGFSPQELAQLRAMNTRVLDGLENVD